MAWRREKIWVFVVFIIVIIIIVYGYTASFSGLCTVKKGYFRLKIGLAGGFREK